MPAATPADMLLPRGRVNPRWLAHLQYGEEEDYLRAWIEEAEADPALAFADDPLQAVRRWVEYRALSAAAAEAATSAGLRRVTLHDQGSYEMGTSGADGYARNAGTALAAWRLLTAPPEAVRSADGRFTRYSRAWPVTVEEEEAT
jgi:hypothetical protein